MLPFLLLGALLAGCTDPVPVDDPAAADEPATHAAEWTLHRGAAHELNFDMPEGGDLAYRINASAPVRWDLHSHAADGTVATHDEGEGRAAEGTFTAPVAGVYSIFARSTTSTAVVRVELAGSFSVRE